MGLISRVAAKRAGNIIDKTLDIVEETVTDKDAYNKLAFALKQRRAELMLSGAGSSITKITICGLVSLVVGAITYKYLSIPIDITGALAMAMAAARDYAISVTPLIGTLIGVYGTFSALKKSKWSK